MAVIISKFHLNFNRLYPSDRPIVNHRHGTISQINISCILSIS